MRNDFDARNFTNPTNTTSAGALSPIPESRSNRNQFGGDGGGAIKKDKLFMFLTYEGLAPASGRSRSPPPSSPLRNARKPKPPAIRPSRACSL